MVHHCACLLKDATLSISAPGCGQAGFDSKATLAGHIATALLILVALLDGGIDLSLLLGATHLLCIDLQAASV